MTDTTTNIIPTTNFLDSLSKSRLLTPNQLSTCPQIPTAPGHFPHLVFVRFTDSSRGSRPVPNESLAIDHFRFGYAN